MTDHVLATIAVNIANPNDQEHYPVHVRADEESLFVDIHLDDSELDVLGFELPLLAIAKLTEANAAPDEGGDPGFRVIARNDRIH